jgi:hypothetical protein
MYKLQRRQSEIENCMKALARRKAEKDDPTVLVNQVSAASKPNED